MIRQIVRYGQALQRYLPRAASTDFTAHVPPHLLFQYGPRGINPKTLQCLMDHSDVTVTMNTCLRLGLDDAQQEKLRHQERASARKEIEKMAGKKPEGILIKMA